nr:hypothetical protein [Tanacetum cinerariifolium]
PQKAKDGLKRQGIEWVDMGFALRLYRASSFQRLPKITRSLLFGFL